MNKLSAKHIMLLIAMCGIVGICMGLCINVNGIFYTPISEEFGIGRAAVSFPLTVASLVAAGSGMISSKLIRPSNFRPMMILWITVIAGTTALLATCKNIIMMYLLFGIRGFGTGLIGLVMVTPIINRWFYKNVGVFTSIAVGFSGLTGAVFSPVLNSVIQSYGWRTAYIVTAILIVIYGLPSILFPIGIYPRDAGTQPYGTRTAITLTAGQASDKISPVLIAFVAVFSCCASYCTALTSHFPGIAESFALSSGIGALMISAAMICNTGGKVLLGILIDTIGCKKSCMLFLTAVALGALSILTIHAAAGMFLGASLIGLIYSVATVGVVMVTKECFGDANYSKVYPTITLITTVVSCFGSPMVGLLYDLTGSYAPGLLSAAVLPVVAIIALNIAYARKA